MKNESKRHRGLVMIPARRASTRLPNKLLLARTGQPLLAHVVDRALQAVRCSEGLLEEVVVAHDDDELASVARRLGVRAVRTGDHHRCGTTRIAEAVRILGNEALHDLVVNVQGDEPELDPAVIVRVARELVGDPSASMATLAIPMPTAGDHGKSNPNAVKVVLDRRGRALYFSRAPIPFDRAESGGPAWHHHLGIYAYRRTFLLEFADLPMTPLEERESLEQLRALETGHAIKVALVAAEQAGKGIDTQADYEAFVARYRAA